jgi:type I restriction enzyme M protein
MDEEKELKTAVKKDTAALHLLTKDTIEGLTDEQALALLEEKWIKPLLAALHRIPDAIITELISCARALCDKYATTYSQDAEQIAETKSALSQLIEGLTGNDFDMKGLHEFKRQWSGNHLMFIGEENPIEDKYSDAVDEYMNAAEARGDYKPNNDNMPQNKKQC